jgi:hypothetical protein
MKRKVLVTGGAGEVAMENNDAHRRRLVNTIAYLRQAISDDNYPSR